MCHHQLSTEILEGSNIYSDELLITIASLRFTQWSDEDMGSRPVHHQDSTQHQQKLFGAGLQHAWITPMGN